MLLLCYLCPPLAVACMGMPGSAIFNFFLWIWPWGKSINHAKVCYADYRFTQHEQKTLAAINQPDYVQSGRKKIATTAPAVDDPLIGASGTKFRSRN